MKAFAYKKGNVLFLILIAVALFAALSYAVTNTMRGGVSASSETERLAFYQMQQYGAAISAAVTRMRLINNCRVLDISLAADNWDDPSLFNKATAPANESCHLFSSNGGQIAWQAPPQIIVEETGATEYHFNGRYDIRGLSSSSLQPTFSMFSYMTQEMCMAYNEEVGIENGPGHAPYKYHCGQNIPAQNLNDTFRHFWQDQEGIGYGSNFAGRLIGQQTGCFYCASNATHYFYYALYIQ